MKISRMMMEELKEIIKFYFELCKYGMFNTRSISGDQVVNVYDDNGVIIDACFDYGYFEVFGLSNEDYEDLKEYYYYLQIQDEEKRK